MNPLETLLWLALMIDLGVIGVWLWQHVEMRRIHRDGLWVPVMDREPPSEPTPSVTVIIPARNESAHIGDCVRSVLSQELSDLRVIIADDRSADNTGSCARKASNGDPRLTLHRIDRLPAGWLGKSHALWSAVQAADSSWLLFIDADCRLRPHAVRSAMHYAAQRKADLLSLWPRDGSRGFWERLLIPLCGAMIVIWYGSRHVNDRNRPEAFANGQFILIRREAYFRFEGHSAVRHAIIEDVPLARKAKSTGLAVLTALGTDLYSVRMYGSLTDVVRGWRRIYVGVLSRSQIVLSMLSIVIGSLPPYVIVPITAIAVWHGAGGWWRVWLWAGGIHLCTLMVASVRFFSLARCRLRYLWLYPLSCVGVLYILGSALRHGSGLQRITWRGTQYEVDSARIVHRDA